MRTLIAILTFCVCWLNANAQLHFIPADSIVTWDSDVANLRNTALEASAHLTPQYISADFSQGKMLQTSWEKEAGKHNMNPFAIANRFTLAAKLLTLTADAKYALEMEQVIYKALLQQASTPTLSAEKVTAAQTLLNAVGTMLATQGDTLYVNYYANSTATIPTSMGSLQLDIVTGMPFHERVKFRFARMTQPKGMQVTICLRLPEGEWNDTSFPIYCNGHDTPYHIEKGYAVITNTWRPGFEIYFDLPEPLLKLE